MANKIIISCAITGSIHTPTMSDALPITPDQIRSWREHINARVARDAGFAYQSFVRLKLIAAYDFVARILVRLSGSTPQSLPAQAIAHIVDAWALKSRNSYAEPDGLMLRQRRRRPNLSPQGHGFCWHSTSNTASAACISSSKGSTGCTK